jgi:DnaJ-class molecular chaperone
MRMLEMQGEEPCPTCKGRGCRTCGGAGAVLKSKRLEVKIPPGVREGSRVRIAGKGGPGQMGGEAGDLYLLISVKPDDRFQRTEDDLHVDVPVLLTDAILGGEVEVPTLEGKKLALKIPPETQNGKVFRLAGQGMPRLGNNTRGDLYSASDIERLRRIKTLIDDLGVNLAGVEVIIRMSQRMIEMEREIQDLEQRIQRLTEAGL